VNVMQRIAENLRYLPHVRTVLLFALGASASHGVHAADQATKARCAAYAQRAVQQYRLMKAHPQCDTNADPLTWQDNYDNHFNGCLLLPAKMAQLAEQARDNHLLACGGMSANPASAAPATSGAPSGTPQPGSPQPSSPQPSAVPAGSPPATEGQHPPAVMEVCAPRDPHGCGVWTWSTDHYDGVWKGAGVTARLTVVSFVKDSVVIERVDYGRAGRYVYKGTISAQGESIDGEWTDQNSGERGPFTATWGKGADSSAGVAAASGGGATPTGTGSATSSLVTPAPGFGGIGCKGPPGQLLTGRVSGSGLVTDLKGPVLSFHGTPPVTSQTTAQAVATMASSLGQYPIMTALVARPQFFATCRGIPAVSALGPWVAAGGLGQAPRYVWVDVGGILTWQEITADAAKAFMTGGSGASAAASAAAPAKPAAPGKPAH
jgi:hypothetical protein